MLGEMQKGHGHAHCATCTVSQWTCNHFKMQDTVWKEDTSDQARLRRQSCVEWRIQSKPWVRSRKAFGNRFGNLIFFFPCHVTGKFICCKVFSSGVLILFYMQNLRVSVLNGPFFFNLRASDMGEIYILNLPFLS